jgi:uncharacterized protein YkwD
MSLNGNWVDLVILVILFFYVLEGYRRGFWVLVAELGSFVGSLVVALRFYPETAKILISNFSLPNSLANAIGFLMVAFLAEIGISILLARFVFPKLPKKLWEHKAQKYLGIIPSVLNGVILIAFFLTLFIALPINPKIKSDINSSKFGGYLVSQTVRFEKRLADVFGGAVKDTLTYFTIDPQSKEKIDLTYSPRELKVDEVAEAEMFKLVNEERKKKGIHELVWSPQIVPVARRHSRDMWERKYFAHVNPDGEDPADRLTEGGVEYGLAGENLALAPTSDLAHDGLMNSEGHKRNILDPNFRKIGIGVIDGGVYGKMFTQNFTD